MMSLIYPSLAVILDSTRSILSLYLFMAASQASLPSLDMSRPSISFTAS
jgi:hypothetical protein